MIPPNTIEQPEEFRYNFKTGTPDLQNFPRAQWIRATSKAIAAMAPDEFGYGHRTGAEALREALADYLGRVRGVSADPQQVLCVGGFDQARTLFAEVLWQRGIRQVATEDPGYIDRKVFIESRDRDDPRAGRRRRDHRRGTREDQGARPCCCPRRTSTRPAA